MRQIEKQILDAAISITSENEGLFVARGLKVDEPLLKVRVDDPRSSEINITFMRDGNVSDVLEFEIFNKGHEMITLDDAQRWLREQIPSVQ